MKKLLAVVTTVALVSCASSKLLYDLSNPEGWAAYSSPCSGPLGTYERTLAEGVRLQLRPRRRADSTTLSLDFYLDRGHTVQLSQPSLHIHTAGGPASAFHIGKFLSGSRDPRNDSRNLVEFVELSGSALLTGTDRFALVPPEYRAARGDVFVATVKLSDQPLESFRAVLPPLLVDGQPLVVPSVTFEYRPVTFVQCVQ